MSISPFLTSVALDQYKTVSLIIALDEPYNNAIYKNGINRNEYIIIHFKY